LGNRGVFKGTVGTNIVTNAILAKTIGLSTLASLRFTGGSRPAATAGLRLCKKLTYGSVYGLWDPGRSYSLSFWLRTGNKRL
jgi:hypothetical protein